MPDGTTITGRIDSVSFDPAPAPPAVRVTVTAHAGKAVLTEKMLEACSYSLPGAPQIATVALKYQFTFDGQKMAPDAANPPSEYSTAVAPVTSYSLSQ